MENPIKIHDLGVPLFLVQHPYVSTHIVSGLLDGHLPGHLPSGWDPSVVSGIEIEEGGVRPGKTVSESFWETKNIQFQWVRICLDVPGS